VLLLVFDSQLPLDLSQRKIRSDGRKLDAESGFAPVKGLVEPLRTVGQQARELGFQPLRRGEISLPFCLLFPHGACEVVPVGKRLVAACPSKRQRTEFAVGAQPLWPLFDHLKSVLLQTATQFIAALEVSQRDALQAVFRHRELIRVPDQRRLV